MDDVLWSAGGKPDQIAAINRLGYLTGKYDQYQDAYPPGTNANFMTTVARRSRLQADGSMTQGWLLMCGKME